VKSIVGYVKENYPETRTIINKIPGVIYKKVHLFPLQKIKYLILNISIKIIKKTLKISIRKRKPHDFLIYDLIFPNTNRIHFFNTIYLSYGKWVSTFETTIPRITQKYSVSEYPLNAIHSLARNNCIAIIALSNNAFQIQTKFIRNYPGLKDNIKIKILSKLAVLHPPQMILINNITEKEYDRLSFIFIGNDFFRKGGMEVLNAFEKLFNNKIRKSISLIVISKMTIDNWVIQATDIERKNAIEFMKKNSQWIKFYNGLQNDKVLELIKTADVGLLPTMADTYGYSVLEMQACGVPVISTDIRALPEINNNECGWIIPIIKNCDGNVSYKNDNDILFLREDVEKKLYDILELIIDHPDRKRYLFNKSKAALERIKLNHSPEKYGNKLKGIMKL